MSARGGRALAMAALLAAPCGLASAQRADALVLRLPARRAPTISYGRSNGPANATTPAVSSALSNATAPNAVVRPDLEPGRVAGELLVGSYGGIGGFFLGRYAGLMITDLVASPTEDTRDGIAFASGVVGAWVGTTVGVYAIGNIGNQTGSLGTTAFGAGIGAVAGAFLDRLVFAPRSGDPSAGASAIRWGETVVESFLPAIGATIGFNSSRKYK